VTALVHLFVSQDPYSGSVLMHRPNWVFCAGWRTDADVTRLPEDAIATCLRCVDTYVRYTDVFVKPAKGVLK